MKFYCDETPLGYFEIRKMLAKLSMHSRAGQSYSLVNARETLHRQKYQVGCWMKVLIDINQ